MEIGPIPGIRAFATVKPLPAGPEISANFDIDGITRGRDSLRPEARTSGGGEDEEDQPEDANPEDEGQSESDSSDEPLSSVSFFA